jgi:hypothetical protein
MAIERTARRNVHLDVEVVGPSSGLRPKVRFGAHAATAATVDGVTPLDQLRLGALDVDAYVEEKIADATAHLAGLPHAQLAFIERSLRDAIEDDEVLAELVRRIATTGS